MQIGADGAGAQDMLHGSGNQSRKKNDIKPTDGVADRNTAWPDARAVADREPAHENQEIADSKHSSMPSSVSP
jgi:hypothetical protein